MSVVSIKPASGRSGDFGLATDSSAKRMFRIVVTSKLDDEVYIRNYGQSNTYNGQRMLPLPYVDAHPTLPAFICKNLSITQDKSSPLIWEATATYSSRPVSNLDLQVQEAPDPILRPAEISWATVSYQKACLKDINGKPIVNSAGDTFDPPVEFTLNRYCATVTKNLLVVPGWLLDYESAVNSDAYVIDGLSVPAEKSRISGLTISALKREKIAAGIEFFYRTVSFRIEFAREGWKLKVLDMGYRYKDPSDATKRIPIPEDGSVKFSRPVTSPRLLDGAGGVLANPSPTTAVFLSFDAYPLKPFNGYLPLT